MIERITKDANMAILKAAATAAGLRISSYRHPEGAYVTSATRRAPFRWNPEHDSRDALDLAALLRIPIWYQEYAVIADQRVCGSSGWRVEFGINDGDREKATRRAIFLAAAARAVTP